MIKYRAYNFDMQEMKTWPVTDKSKAIEIHDSKNKVCFHIEFGKNPKISIYELDDEVSLGERKFEIQLKDNQLNILDSEIDINIRK